MTKRFRIFAIAAGAAVAAVSVPAVAGEIKGPPPGSNLDPAPRLSNGNSICSYSGLNDTPDGQGLPGDENFDPGGQTQSFGSFLGSSGYPVSTLDPRSDFLSPGFACNPTRGPAFHGG
jgi:hypothetical protein